MFSLAVSKINISVFLIHATSCFQGKKLQTDGKTTMLPCQGKLTKLRIIRPCAMSFTSKVYDGSLVSQVWESNFLTLFHCRTATKFWHLQACRFHCHTTIFEENWVTKFCDITFMAGGQFWHVCSFCKKWSLGRPWTTLTFSYTYIHIPLTLWNLCDFFVIESNCMKLLQIIIHTWEICLLH